MTDSIQLAIDSVNLLSHDIDLIQKIDSFYSNAWDKLILFGSIAFGLAGVVIPIVIQWFQRRTIKLSEELLKNEITKSADEIKKELLNDLSEKIDQKLEHFEQHINHTNASANAKIFFAQGKFNLEKNYYPVALNELITASYSCIECKDYQTLQKVLQSMSNDCVPYLSKEEIKDLKVANVSDLSSFLEDLTKADDKSIFHEIIGQLKVKITKLPLTIKDKPSEQTKM